ncbi:hypothetical protein [Oceaniglobus trochenteri]|uniref:hypothetical protein n=1 Tax=Oceaniglobus trochenteri TaxID=2763260 RepID=UPI001CFFB01E|nr:hypothetical protein [Oceaniglobus trochenteri]
MGIPFHTQTGTIDLSELEPRDFRPFAIADTLAKINRFNGRTCGPWSVASHSVLVSQLCPPAQKANGLLHDAHEFIIGDLTSPAVAFLRRDLTPLDSLAVDYAISQAKGRLDVLIGEAWGVDGPFMTPEVRKADQAALQAEMFFHFGEKPECIDAESAELCDRAIAMMRETEAQPAWWSARDAWLAQAEALAARGQFRLPT